MSNNYKCPSCGGPLTFDQSSQKLKCPFCDFEQDIKDFEDEDVVSKSHIKTDVTNLYLCSSCGGEVIMEDKSAASTCPFCDNP
ncbi:MAG TPA: Trm112 family protein, partial [Erysipelotrichaceae bacterium]|nr:Trm112 family protein [Erysipelotrichaceae bacterium]